MLSCAEARVAERRRRFQNFGVLLLPCCLVVHCLAFLATPAQALTPIESADLSPDTTVALDGQTISDDDVAEDDVVSGNVTKAPLGTLPLASDLAAYHEFLGADEFWMVFDITVSLAGGVVARPNDVVRYDGVNYSIEFDGAAEGVPVGVRIDAVSVSDAENLVLSFDTTVALGGVAYADEDLVEFDGASFSSFFDGSAAGVSTALDVDGAHVFPGTGTLALSFDVGGSVGGVDFDDEDVLEYDPSGPMWEIAWDTSIERPEWLAGADVNAVFFVPEPGMLWGLASGCATLAWLERRRRSTRD